MKTLVPYMCRSYLINEYRYLILLTAERQINIDNTQYTQKTNISYPHTHMCLRIERVGFLSAVVPFNVTSGNNNTKSGCDNGTSFFALCRSLRGS